MTKPKVDLSEFFRLSKPKKPPCRIGFARGQLSETEQTQLDAALETDGNVITGTAIVEWLAKRDQEVNTSSVTSHRAGRCSCREA